MFAGCRQRKVPMRTRAPSGSESPCTSVFSAARPLSCADFSCPEVTRPLVRSASMPTARIRANRFHFKVIMDSPFCFMVRPFEKGSGREFLETPRPIRFLQKQAGVKKGRIWVSKWKGGGYHTKSCKTLLFESITHYNFNPYVKKSDLQSLCKTVVWNLLLQNAPPLLLPTIEPSLFSPNMQTRPP